MALMSRTTDLLILIKYYYLILKIFFKKNVSNLMWKYIGISNSPSVKLPEHKLTGLLSYGNIFTYVDLFFRCFWKYILWNCIWSWNSWKNNKIIPSPASLLRNAPEQVLPRYDQMSSPMKTLPANLYIIYCEAEARVRQGQARDGP